MATNSTSKGKTTGKAPEASACKSFQPISLQEYYRYESEFEKRLSAALGEEAITAFTRLQFLQIAAENGVTEAGQAYVTKARKHLNKFLGLK